MWLNESEEEKNPKIVWWNDVVKAAVERKDAVEEEVLGAKYKVAKDRCMKVYKKKRVRLKYVYIRSKRYYYILLI